VARTGDEVEAVVAFLDEQKMDLVLSTPFIQVIGKRRGQANAKISSPFDSPTQWRPASAIPADVCPPAG
jgi:hypothetical protein